MDRARQRVGVEAGEVVAVHRRRAIRPACANRARDRPHRFVGARGAQHQRVAEHRADELQADRQAGRRQAARDRAGRLLRQVERIGERRPAEHRRSDPSANGRPACASNAGTATVGVTSRSKRCMNWRISEPSAPRRRFRRCTSSALHLGAELGLGDEVGIGDRLLLGRQRVPQGPRADEPQAGGDLQRVFEAGVDRFDVRAEFGAACRLPWHRPRPPRDARSSRSRAPATTRCAGRGCRRRGRRV